MSIVVCPGFHDSFLTSNFICTLRELLSDNISKQIEVNILVYPEKNILSLSGYHIVNFLNKKLPPDSDQPLLFIGFSAGVVGAISASHLWKSQGGKVKALIAFDGWGVPLVGDFPIHRISHDYFTHWSSLLLGSGNNNFYALPFVSHLELWRSLDQVHGFWVNLDQNMGYNSSYISATEFLFQLLKAYNQIY